MFNLSPCGRIDEQDWLKAPQSIKIMQVLNGGEQSAQALFVGGCVRNAVLTQSVDDVDIATTLKPDEVTKRLEAAGFKVIPTGVEHGTVTAVLDGAKFEVTTLRHDIETDGRHAKVSYTEDWVEDARRRDFTMNTLLADIEGHVYDPLGIGYEDLKARRVIFVGDAKKRIEEDYLRILRFFRFHALYGAGEPDTEGLLACKHAAVHIASLSKERVTAEFFKILSSKNAAQILSLMWGYNVLKGLRFDGYSSDILRFLCDFQERYGLEFLAARLYALCAFDINNLGLLEKYLLIPKVFKRDMDMIVGVLSLPDLDNDHAVKVAVYKFGRVATAQSLIIELVQDRVMNGYAPKALDIIQNWDVPNFPLSGQDLMKEGFEAGPSLGAELAAREEAWIESGFK